MTPILAAALLLGTAVAQETRPAPRATPGRNPRTADLVEVAALDPGIRLDVRYATTNNFMGRVLYSQPRVFLRRTAAQALVRAHRNLAKSGYGLLLFDGYRPWRVTKAMWDATPPAKRSFVANPVEGSKHNRGCAVDLSMYQLDSGREAEMPSAYDEFSERASPTYRGGTPAQTARRDLLRRVMEAEGFTVEPNEWWHFNCRDWRSHPILDVPFEELPPAR